MKRINKTEEYMLYYDQFLALQEQGRLKEGSIYHILDLPDGLDLVEGKWTVKKAEQDAEGNIIHETYVKRLDLDYQVVDSLPTDKTAGKMIYLKNDGFNLSNLKISNGNEYISFIPTKTSDLENDIHFATEDYVEQNGGKIDKILLNNEEQAIVGKAVNLTINKTTVGLSNVDNTSDLNKPISTQTQTALDGLNQTITNNFNNLNSSIENETERATLAETEISTKLQQEMNTRVQEHAEIQGKIDTINSKIPNQASSTNQLADKDFVNSTINSSAAFFKGSFKSKAALDAVQWQTTDSSLTTYVSNNDYAYVEADETHNNEAWRYIYVKDNTVSEWQPQFRVNESPFTQSQLDAINSGATTDLINSIGSKLTQDAIVDSTGDSSTKAISQRAATLGINTIQNNLNTHILDKNNPHQVTKVQIGLGNVDNTSDLDKPISTAVQNALEQYLPLSGGAMTGDIIIPYSFGLKTPDGAILLMPYAGSDGNPGSLYISEKTRNTIINGHRDRPQYNCLASGVTDIALMSDLDSYLPLTGGVLTGQVKLAETGIRTTADDGYSTDKWGNLNALSSDAGALFKINSYDKSKSLTYAWNTGVLNLPAKPLINNQDVLALKSDIISSDGFVTIDTVQTITGKKTFNNSISIGSCTQTYNASTKSLVYSFE